jgi:predicted amidohydrolase YtcJ
MKPSVIRIRRGVAVAVVAAGSVAAIAVAASTGRFAAPAAVVQGNAPDMVLYNGKISTVDGKDSVVEAIAIRGGTILAAGQSGPVMALASKATKLVNLKGRRVLPGLIDGHLHGMREGYHCWTQVVRLDLVTKRADALAAYKAKADKLADGLWIWTTSGGWNVNQLDNPTPFTFAELTAAAPANPVWIQGTGFVGVRVNQAALTALGLRAGSPGVTLGADGQPTGELAAPATAAANAAILAQLNTLGIEGEARCLADFIRTANGKGLTAFKDAGGNDAPWGSGGAINEGNHVEEGAEFLYANGGLNARIAYNDMHGYLGLARVISDTQNSIGFLGDDMFRYLGPGEDTMVTTPGFVDYTRYAAGKRLSVETHVGPPIDGILDGFEAANGVYPIGKLKWRIAHPGGGEPTDPQLARAKALGIGWAMTFSGIRNGGASPRYRTTMLNSAHMCLATDAMNVAPWAPFQTLWMVVSGQTLLPGVAGVPAEERLTRKEALRHATVDCGWFLDLDGKVGTLEPGKYADLIVLSKDYFTVPAAEIKEINSLLTIVNGRVVYASGEYKPLER